METKVTVLVLGPCVICGRVFGFEPDRVETVAVTGLMKRPVCRRCVVEEALDERPCVGRRR